MEEQGTVERLFIDACKEHQYGLTTGRSYREPSMPRELVFYLSTVRLHGGGRSPPQRHTNIRQADKGIRSPASKPKQRRAMFDTQYPFAGTDAHHCSQLLRNYSEVAKKVGKKDVQSLLNGKATADQTTSVAQWLAYAWCGRRTTLAASTVCLPTVSFGAFKWRTG